jgi:hypothetical protein
MKKTTFFLLIFSLTGGGWAWSQTISAGAFVAPPKSTAAATPKLFNARYITQMPPPPKYQRPEDLIELVPVLRDLNRLLPRHFSLADHNVVLSPDAMEVSHSYHPPGMSRLPKNSMVIFGYEDFSPRWNQTFEMPLFFSPQSNFGDLAPYPFGSNYTWRVTRGDSGRTEFYYYLRARTRF